MHCHTDNFASIHSAFSWLHSRAHRLVTCKENFRTSCQKTATEVRLLHMPLGWDHDYNAKNITFFPPQRLLTVPSSPFVRLLSCFPTGCIFVSPGEQRLSSSLVGTEPVAHRAADLPTVGAATTPATSVFKAAWLYTGNCVADCIEGCWLLLAWGKKCSRGWRHV